MSDTSKTHNWDCEFCCFKTNNKKDFGRHLLTGKHIKNVGGYKKDIIVLPNTSNEANVCECGKSYHHNSGLWRHKKTCSYVEIKQPDESEPSKNDIIKQLIIQNQQLIFENKEFKEFMMEQSKHMMEQMIMKSTATESSS